MEAGKTLPKHFDSWREFYLELKQHKLLHHQQIIYNEHPDVIRPNTYMATSQPQKFDVSFIKDQVVEEYLALYAPSNKLSEDDCSRLIKLLYASSWSAPGWSVLLNKLKTLHKHIRARRVKKSRDNYQVGSF